MHENRTLIMIAWLLENSAELNRQDRVQIIFNCSGDEVGAETKRRFQLNTDLNGTAKRLEAMAEKIRPYLGEGW